MFDLEKIKKDKLLVSVFYDENINKFILSVFSKKYNKRSEISFPALPTDLSPYFLFLHREVTKI